MILNCNWITVEVGHNDNKVFMIIHDMDETFRGEGIILRASSKEGIFEISSINCPQLQSKPFPIIYVRGNDVSMDRHTCEITFPNEATAITYLELMVNSFKESDRRHKSVYVVPKEIKTLRSV